MCLQRSLQDAANYFLVLSGNAPMQFITNIYKLIYITDRLMFGVILIWLIEFDHVVLRAVADTVHVVIGPADRPAVTQSQVLQN